MTPLALAATYLAFLNLTTFGLFWWDKQCAIHRRWRVPESTLLTLCLVGGAFGAKTGQGVFRPKTRKEPFRTSLHAIIGLHIGLISGLVLPDFRAAVMALLHDASTALFG